MTSSKICTYLLHFERPIGHVQHYLGSTQAGRLAERMQEHAKGRGAALTREACRRGIGWTITASWLTPDRQFEKARKRIRKYSRNCAVCQQTGFVAELFTVRPVPVPVASHGTQLLHWPATPKR